ncbi:sugar ABC transporter ATP-binding protein [Bradyrhizobium manausense]|uniref:Sugar ABC transporter ATP-binding protein n=1 Tax=Bradyrhizobium manausense TaxID=989370 RepID=A0A0R3E0W9_9BRAD|nr:sugar ABC transporter ATP-binding protein [Bradyrhizobium manausense]
MRRPALRISSVCKRFGSLIANDDVSFTLEAGQVLALLGENGAGKTTLMNILFGHYVADSGAIEIGGASLSPGSPQAALRAGIGMVHQHFALADNLSVAENIIIGTESLLLPWHRAKAKEKILDIARRYGLALDPDALVRDISVGERQRVEIVKALYRDARILVLDEPTAVLTPQEAEALFATLRILVSNGVAVIFISHKLREVLSVADKIIVMRQGKVVAERRASETSREELAELMVGRKVAFPDRKPVSVGPAVLRLDGIVLRQGGNRPHVLDGVNLEVRQHEILGIAGIAGNGQAALADIACGVLAPSEGLIHLSGDPVRSDPSEFVKRGVARIPEDRHATGLIPDMSVWENVVAERYRSEAFAVAGLQRVGAARKYAELVIAQFDVRGAAPNTSAKQLSGGNMQKLILGRTLLQDPGVIVATQPTRGLDIGAVAYVHRKLLEARDRGAGILLISEDIDELFSLSDRIAVMFRGSLSSPVRTETLSLQELGLRMAGQNSTGGR